MLPEGEYTLQESSGSHSCAFGTRRGKHTLQESNGSESYRFGTGNHRGQGEDA